jgi:aminoglycoside phosphotransferase (APT) family kinase protein
VVLRAYLPGREALTPERARREFRTIELARASGVPSSEPLYLDADGRFLGRPAMLLSYLSGQSVHRPRDLVTWANDLAVAMHGVHAVGPEDADLSWLPRFGAAEIRSELDEVRDSVMALDDGVAAAALEMLEARFEDVAWPEECLIHGDFWPGNTVWGRGRLVGVIDWADARLGDPRLDVVQCRVDALVANGFEACDAIGAAYDRMAEEALPDMWYVELFLGLQSLRWYKHWLAGYWDVGLTDITEEQTVERIREFLRRAIEEAIR